MKNFLLITLISFFVFNLNAQEEKKDTKEKASDAISNLSLAKSLANYGYENESALSLIQAAAIVIKYPIRELEVEKSEESEGDDGEKTSKEVELSPKKLLKDARSFANEDENIIALIDKEEAKIKKETVKSKGRVYGPASVNRKVYAKSRYTDYILFRGGDLAEVAIVGDGDTDLDLYVYDENGNLVGSDTDYSDNCYVSFYPKWTGSFKILVINRGSVYNRYLLLTN